MIGQEWPAEVRAEVGRELGSLPSMFVLPLLPTTGNLLATNTFGLQDNDGRVIDGAQALWRDDLCRTSWDFGQELHETIRVEGDTLMWTDLVLEPYLGIVVKISVSQEILACKKERAPCQSKVGLGRGNVSCLWYPHFYLLWSNGFFR